MINKSKKEQIQIILESFDFEFVHKAMEKLDLKWKDTENGGTRVPTIDELVIIAEDCMQNAFKNEVTGFAKIGQFEAEVTEGVVEIRFVLAHASPLSKLLG